MRGLKQVVLRRTVCVDKRKAKGSEVNVGRPMWNTMANEHKPSRHDDRTHMTHQAGENTI